MAKNNGNAAGAASHTAQIPEVLRGLDRWITWRYAPHPIDGSMTKRPDCALVQAPRLCSFDDAQADAPPSSVGGLGFVFTGGVKVEGGYVHALDIDACRDPYTGAVEPWAAAIVDQYRRSWTEITPSLSGLRLWLILPEPVRLPKIRVLHAPPPDVTKKPEVQVFGSGAAQYVTVTGYVLPGCSPVLERFEDLAWLQETFGVDKDDAVPVELPEGRGNAPSALVIRQRIESSPSGPELLGGAWHDLHGLDGKSASDAWWRLVQHGLKAAENHGEALAEFLLGETPWGRGLVDSRDPNKYARRGWVLTDIARVAGKTDTRQAIDTFDDDFDCETWRPSAAAQLSAEERDDPEDPWILHGPEYVEGASAEFPFIVHDLIPAGALVQVFGAPSCGKTPFTLSLALAIACGQETFCGHDIDQSGAVLYMVGEGGPGLANRIRAQLELSALDGVFPESPFYVTTRPGRLSDAKNVQAWARKIGAATDGRALRLLVVDTQNMNFGDGDENSTEDMTRFLQNCKRLAAVTGAAVLLVHHTGLRNTDRARGSSTQLGAVDAQFEVKRAERLVTVTAHKAKDWQEPEPLLFTLSVVTLGEDKKGRPITAVGLTQGEPDPADAFDSVTLEPDGELAAVVTAVCETRGEPTSRSTLAALSGVSVRALRRVLGAAADAGFVDIYNAGRGSRKTAYTVTDKALTTWPHLAAQKANLAASDLLS